MDCHLNRLVCNFSRKTFLFLIQFDVLINLLFLNQLRQVKLINNALVNCFETKVRDFGLYYRPRVFFCILHKCGK